MSSIAGGCKPKGETNLPLCREEVAASMAAEVQAGQVPPSIWFGILLRNYDRNTGAVKRPVKDCSGRDVNATPDAEMAACLLGASPAAALPEQPLVDTDLVLQPTSDGKTLAWATTNKYADGEASGPIAIAELTQRGVAVRALGTLRAYPDKAAMRLEPMGQGQVLVVESRTCDPDDPKKCSRYVRLVPLEGD